MEKGFTIIEVLVSLGIVIVISGIVIFNLNSQRQNSALFRSSQRLSLDLRKAQSFALSAKTFRGTLVPCGWGVHFDEVNSTSYTVFADFAQSQDCSDRDFVRANDGSEDYEVVKLESGVYISNLSGNLTDVVFTPPNSTVRFTPDQSLASIVISSGSSNSRTITINKVGFVSSP